MGLRPGGRFVVFGGVASIGMPAFAAAGPG